jgi:hypothetical protein
VRSGWSPWMASGEMGCENFFVIYDWVVWVFFGWVPLDGIRMSRDGLGMGISLGHENGGSETTKEFS